MKNTDIAMIILVAAVSVVASYFIGNMLLGDPNDRVETIEYMDKISNGIEQPHDDTFNYDASNPTVEVYVGNCGPLEVWSPELKKCLPKTANDENSVDGNNEETTSEDGESGENSSNPSESSSTDSGESGDE